MNHPTYLPCSRTYGLIQAHCAIRTSVRVGKLLLALGVPVASVTQTDLARFPEMDRGEAARLVELAKRIKERYSRET